MNSAIRLSSPELKYISWALDFVAILIAGQVTYFVYLDLPFQWFTWPAIYSNLIMGGGIGLIIFGEKIYRSWRLMNIGSLIRSITLVWGFIFFIIIFGLFITKTAIEVSRAWFVMWGLSSWIALVVVKLLSYSVLRWLRSRGYNYRTVVLVGRGKICDEVQRIVDREKWGGIRIIDLIDTVNLDSKLKSYGENQPNEVWLCIPMSFEEEIRIALKTLSSSTSEIRLVPDVFTLKLINHGVSIVLGMPMLDLSVSPITSGMRVVKEIEDKLLAFAILLLVMPLMVLIAICIYLTSQGPIFFVQKRWGWNGKVISVYKFRTMFVHEDSNEFITQAVVNDVRITRVGAFLRRWSLDELPQFINVLQGRMSIVGPRPLAISHNKYYKDILPKYMLRHKVKPGITGWAQINGYRGETKTLEEMAKRVEYDLYYIENMSLFLDAEIIFKTIPSILVGKMAY